MMSGLISTGKSMVMWPHAGNSQKSRMCSQRSCFCCTCLLSILGHSLLTSAAGTYDPSLLARWRQWMTLCQWLGQPLAWLPFSPPASWVISFLTRGSPKTEWWLSGWLPSDPSQRPKGSCASFWCNVAIRKARHQGFCLTDSVWGL